MNVPVRLYTSEEIVHGQIESIEKALHRGIAFLVTLNQKEKQSTIEFSVNEKEISTLKHDLGLNVQVFNGIRWLPHL